MLKKCSCCNRPANYSLVCVISTVGVPRRPQQCSRAVLFCASCLQKRLKSEHFSSSELRDAVNNAYTALCERLSKRSDRADDVRSSRVAGEIPEEEPARVERD
jgi:hypothetical protein